MLFHQIRAQESAESCLPSIELHIENSTVPIQIPLAVLGSHSRARVKAIPSQIPPLDRYIDTREECESAVRCVMPSISRCVLTEKQHLISMRTDKTTVPLGDPDR